MQRHVYALAILGVLAFMLRFVNEWAPLAVLGLGLYLTLVGERLTAKVKLHRVWNLGVAVPTPGTGALFGIYGLIAMTIGVAGLSLDGNPWLLLATLLLVGLTAVSIERQHALTTDQVRPRDVLQVAVAVSMPCLGLVLAIANSMNLVTGLLVLAIASTLGFFLAPRSFIRIPRQQKKFTKPVASSQVQAFATWTPGDIYDKRH